MNDVSIDQSQSDKKEHPDDQDLQRFINWNRSGSSGIPAVGFDHRLNDAILDHLAVCGTCREYVDTVSLLQRTRLDDGDTRLDDNQHQQIMDYVNGKLDRDAHDETKMLLDTNPDAMLYALRYRNMLQAAGLVDLAMQSSVSEAGASETAGSRVDISQADSLEPDNSVMGNSGADNPDRRPVSGKGNVAGLLASFLALFELRVPATAAAAFTLAAVGIVVLYLAPASEDRFTIASYQDEPVVSFTQEDSLPGLGFFSSATRTSKPYQTVRVELLGANAVAIDWHEIEGATSYNLRLKTFIQGKSVLIDEINTVLTRVEVDLVDPDGRDTAMPYLSGSGSRRFEWEIFGTTDDETSFYTNGGFVISHIDSDEGIQDSVQD